MGDFSDLEFIRIVSNKSLNLSYGNWIIRSSHLILLTNDPLGITRKGIKLRNLYGLILV